MKEYDAILRGYGNPSLRESKVEIGFGARPYRLVWLYNSGIDVWGVDLDKPLLGLTPKSLLKVVRRNGPERAMKSIVRHCVSGRLQWRMVESALREKRMAFCHSLYNEVGSVKAHFTAHLPEVFFPNQKFFLRDQGSYRNRWAERCSVPPSIYSVTYRDHDYCFELPICGESYRLKDRRKAGLVPPRGQEGAESAARSLASDSVTPKTRQKTALGSTPSEAKETHS